MSPYAQTCDPISGMTVNLAVSSLRRTHAIFSRDERAAVSSGGSQWPFGADCGLEDLAYSQMCVYSSVRYEIASWAAVS
jgi:hypothetical protein